jgi:hypothetical protein
MFLKQVVNKEYVAIDITSTEIRVISVHGKEITKWISQPLKDGVVKDGIVLESQTLGLAIDNLFKSAQLPKDRVICTVTGLPFIYRTINMLDTGKAVDTESLERAARKEMSLTDPDMQLAWKFTEAHPERKEKDYFVAGVPKRAISSLTDALTHAGITPYILDIKPLAISRLISAKEALAINLESHYADITVISGGRVRVMHSFTLPAKMESEQDIAMETANGLSKAKKAYNRDYPQNILPAGTPILLSGGLIKGEGVSQLLQQISGHPVSLVSSPFKLPPEVEPSRYAANLGLALKKLPLENRDYHDIDLNLFVRARQPSGRRSKKTLLFAMAGFIIIAGVVLVYSYNMKTAAEGQVVRLKTQSSIVTTRITAAQKVNADTLAQQKAENDNLVNLQKQLESLAAEHQAISAQQQDFGGMAKYVIDALPNHSMFEDIAIEKSVINVRGYSPSPMTVLSFTGELEKGKKISSAVITSLTEAVTEQDPEGVFFEVIVQK